jgi:hypothetical protein
MLPSCHGLDVVGDLDELARGDVGVGEGATVDEPLVPAENSDPAVLMV